MIERHLRSGSIHRIRGTALRLAVQQAFDSYARYYMESFRLPTMSKAAVARPFTIEGWHQVLDGSRQGNGVILALPHLGGWEWAGRWMTDQGYKMTVVVEALDPPELFEWFADLRKDLGMTVVPTGPKAGPAVLEGAARQRDRVPAVRPRPRSHGRRGRVLRRAHHACPPARRRCRIRTGAPLLPVGCYFTPKLQRPPRRRAASRCRPCDAAACATTSAGSRRHWHESWSS